MEQIYYKDGYKYQLTEEYIADISYYISPLSDINTEFIKLQDNGLLIICRHYCWDGPSGPTWDTSNFMRPSLVHDALYQLMRQGHLNPNIYRKRADKLLQQMCIEDGMSKVRAWWVYHGVRIGGKGAASSENVKKILVAPKRKGVK